MALLRIHREKNVPLENSDNSLSSPTIVFNCPCVLDSPHCIQTAFEGILFLHECVSECVAAETPEHGVCY